MLPKLSGRPPLSGDALVPRTETRVDRLLPGSLSVRAAAFRTLAERFGEGELADHILAKWLSDPEADAKWERLAAVVEVRYDGVPEPKPPRVYKYWVILWYFSMGYHTNEIAEQLGVSKWTIQREMTYVRRRMRMKGHSLPEVVAKAIRAGFIP